MKVELSPNAYGLLRHALMFSGDKEINNQGKEVDSQLRLNGEESAQRRHYLKLVNPLTEGVAKDTNEILENARKEYRENHKENDKEPKGVYEANMNRILLADKELGELLVTVHNKKFAVELTDKTVGVLEKYFKQYGDKNGWLTGDDASVEEIELVLGS